MPKVGKTDFPYTKAGIQKAKAWAEMTGEKMQMGKGYKRGGRIDPSSVQEVAHKPIESGTRQAVRYKAKTKEGEERHMVKDIEGLTNEADKRALSSFMLMEAIRNNPDFADTLSAEQATEFMGKKDRSLWNVFRNMLPQYAEGGEVPDSRRLYGSDPRRKKKIMMQTSTEGMPVRGETYKNGGEVTEKERADKISKKMGKQFGRKGALKGALGSMALTGGLGKALGSKETFGANPLSLLLAALGGGGIGWLHGKTDFTGEKAKAIQDAIRADAARDTTSYKKGGKVKMPKGWHT